MLRTLTDDLIKWKDAEHRKPLFLQGIRHSGKTHLIKDFAANYFEDILYLDFEADKNLVDFFGQNLDPNRIIKDLSIYREKDIKVGGTLIVFDEVQYCSEALDSLKYFNEEAPQYHIIAISSSPAVSLQHGAAIPISNVDILTLYPMSFYEFLLAQSPMLAMHLKESGFDRGAYKKFQSQLEEKFCDYQIVGGMPEVVQSWDANKSIEAVDKLLTQTIKSIESDFISLAQTSQVAKLSAIFNSVPVQLTKKNRKFLFTTVKKSWRAKDLDDALFWLMRAGLVYKVEHIEQPALPLTANVNHTHFKLYMCDVGLLRRIMHLPASIILDKSDNNKETKSALIENIVCSDLMQNFGERLYYWSAENPGRAKVEFIVQYDDNIIPIEVKAGSASKARSLSQYNMRFAPKKYILTGKDVDREDILPIYGFWNVKEWLNKKA
ncbi:MAG: AAA family ATPase [Oscillospiraceae bacterium]|jgi:predicted AAA+ superfamily ATPase|nr:AAA family ATPase [Oscillospiraceae bacterium]